MNRDQQHCNRHNRGGSILVLAAVLMVVILAFVALGVDIGYISLTKAQLQNAADAAALAGARALYTNSGQGRTEAMKVAATNYAAGEPVDVDPGQDVEIGNWDRDKAVFVPLTGSDEGSGNAVRVTCWRSSGRGNPLSLFFARILGIVETEVSAVATVRYQAEKCAQFVGIDSVEVNSGYTDSYDSSLGSYASQTPGDEGHVCSNGDIIVKAPVKGDASPGENYDVTIQSGGMVTGSKEPHEPQPYPSTDAGNADVSNDNHLIPSAQWSGDDLKIPSSESVTFSGGTLYASKISISGELRIDGPTTIYVEEKLDISGEGIVNINQRPSDLRIILLDQTGKSSTISGSSDTYATIYGPGAAVNIAGTAAFFGSVIAETLKITNEGGCHFDRHSGPPDKEFLRCVLVE